MTDNAQITTTAYAGGYTYENSSLKFISQAEGYIEPEGAGGYDYVYQYKDHLGNVRLSYKDADDNGVIHGASTQIFFDDFEAATGWDGSGASWGQSITAFDDTLTFDGEYSGRIYGAVGTSVAVHSNEWVAIDNDSDTDYIYTAWAYSESPIIRLGLGMKEDGEAGYLTLFDDILIFDELNKWVYVEKRVTVPAHITSLNVRMECAAWENRVGNVWFDNVSIRRVNAPLDVEIVEEKNYYPFGLVHRGYNSQVQGTYYPYGFNGKEENSELDLEWLDFGARNYDPAIGRWMNLDPLAEDFYSYSVYNSMMNNPINFIDPDGMAAEWVPKVKEDGAVTYVAEKGDSAVTLSSQYGISQEQAEQITGTSGDTEIAEGTEVSGETVEQVTGSEVLQLDLDSSQATDQRIFDQFLFASDYSKSIGDNLILTNDYYTNIFSGSTSNWTGTSSINGFANLEVDGITFKVFFDLRLDAGTSRYNKKRGQFMTNYPTKSSQRNTRSFGKNSAVSQFSNYATKKPWRNNGYSEIISSSKNGHLVSKRFN